MKSKRVTSMTGQVEGSSASVAEQLVREVSSRIGIDDITVKLICDNMQHHCIREEWQVSSLDSLEWQQLGAPIGLAVAIRKLSLPSVEDARNSASGNSFPSVIPRPSSRFENPPPMNMGTSSRSGEGRVWNSTVLHASMVSNLESSLTTNNGGIFTVPDDEEDPASAPAPVQGSVPPSFSSSLARASSSKCDSKCARPRCMRTFYYAYRQYNKLPGNTRTMRSFPATERFDQALLLTKNGHELKAFTVFWMELAILASALFLGAAVEMWSTFPMDAVNDGPLWADSKGTMKQMPHVPRTLAIVYHFVAGSCLIVHLFVTVGWIWILHATAAVSPNKFHIFLMQTRLIFNYFLAFAEVGSFLLTANICLLFSSMVAATTTDPIVLQICYYLPVGLMIVGYCIVHHFTSYIGRAAYHGLLLMDDDPDHLIQERQDGTYVAGSGAGLAETMLAGAFEKHHVFCENEALDFYYQTATTTSAQGDIAYPTLLDVIFPKGQRNVQPATVVEEVETAKTK